MRRTLPEVTAELFVVPVEEAYLVFAPLRQAAFLANSAVVNQIAALREGRLDLTCSDNRDLVRFLRSIELVDSGEEPQPVTTFAGSPKPTDVTLFLTTACNLRCTYCYASAGDLPLRQMSLDTARAAIDFVIANAREAGRSQVGITYHGGGEPSTNWRTLVDSYNHAVAAAAPFDLGVDAGMATNGVLADFKIDWILDHLRSVSLSFDGLPEVHDAHRLTILGEGSSADVIRTLRRFDAAEFNYSLRLTVTHDHIPRLAESVEYICTNFHPQRIQVEPAYQIGRWHDAPSAETDEFISQFRAARQIARAHGRRIDFSGARLGVLTNHFCGVTQDSFCITPDGSVSGCYEVFSETNRWSEMFHYGKFDKETRGYEFKLPILDNLRNQSVDRREFCNGCFAKWSCGGDCYHKSLSVNGSTEFSGTDRCHIIRELTKDQILERIELSGGLFWHEPPAMQEQPSVEVEGISI